MSNKILHKRSSILNEGNAKLPASSDLEYGEIAINYAKGHETISIKNNENEIVEFKSKQYINDTYYTKNETNSMLSGFVSINIVEQMIKDSISRIDGGIITPNESESPDEPVTDNFGEITEDKEIIINENLLSAGTYTLKYIDNDDNVIDNFKSINEFTI